MIELFRWALFDATDAQFTAFLAVYTVALVVLPATFYRWLLRRLCK